MSAETETHRHRAPGADISREPPGFRDDPHPSLATRPELGLRSGEKSNLSPSRNRLHLADGGPSRNGSQFIARERLRDGNFRAVMTDSCRSEKPT